ncbi:SpoIIAA family protein [Flavobacterium rhizosphaerae]|uniref:STAS/SEC14 domain-containing protein n=1 Tax=Flavobacterium rhizosphaerae TaxID=3163298 RepID=A0ABW8YS32_9FLAO
MIETLTNVPKNVAAFRAVGEVTKEDYEKVLVPKVQEVAKNNGEINFMYVIDTDLSDFTLGAWLRDALLGLEEFSKWNRAAIVTDSDTAVKFTNAFSVIAPGEYKGFSKNQMQEALSWVAGSN